VSAPDSLFYANSVQVDLMKIEAIIWDIDGVLIDSEEYHIEAEVETLKKFGIELSLPVAKEYFGVKLKDYFTDIVKRYKKNIPVHTMITQHYNTLIRYYRKIFPVTPGAFEVLGELQKRYRMGIATSREKELADIALKRFSLFPFFETIVYGEDVQNGKPDPEPFLTACKRLNTNPHLCVVIEDSLSGVAAAKKAGMLSIVRKARHNADLDFSNTGYTINDLNEIPPLLLKMEQNG